MRIVSPLLGLDLHAVDIDLCNTRFHRIFGLFSGVLFPIHHYINHMAQVMVYMLMVCLNSYE